MRSGQYKLAGAGSREVLEGVTLGQFRSSTCNLAGSDAPEPDFPHMNSLLVTRGKSVDGAPSMRIRDIGSGLRSRMGEPRHNKSCENLSTRVRSLLSRPRPAPPQEAWQYGHVVTLPRRPRAATALSHHHPGSDTVSCLSASSGYSSSASSNYGSFKSSSSSNCSTLPRPAPPSPRPATLVDNPMYDVAPGSHHGESHIYDETPDGQEDPLYDTIPAARLLTPDSGTHGGPDSLDSLDPPDSLEPPDPPEDQVARQCREYFEQRVKNSESLKKRWSMCSQDSGADSGDSDSLPQSLNANPSSGPPDTQAPSAPNTESTPTSSTSAVKTPLDQKMDFLRKEIASLMKQDNALFEQLLTLHQSISALKTSPPQALLAFRPPSPSSLDSFTEEDEDDEDDDDDDDDDDEQVVVGGVGVNGGGDGMIVSHPRTLLKVDDGGGLSEVDEGLDTDDHHSTSHSNSPTSTLSSTSSYNSFSKTSPLDSSPHQPFQRDTGSPQALPALPPLNSPKPYPCLIRSRKSYAPTARNRRRSSSAHLLIRPELSCPDQMRYLETETDRNGLQEPDRSQRRQSDVSPEGRGYRKAESDEWDDSKQQQQQHTPRPRSSSAILPPTHLHLHNYHDYHHHHPATTTTTPSSATRPLPQTPYREALIM